MMAIGLSSDLELISSCVWACMLRAPLGSWNRMFASISKSYQVDLTSRVTSPFEENLYPSSDLEI